MSLLADERAVILGKQGKGSVAAYTLAHLQRLRLETIVFTYVTDSSGTQHNPLVQLTDQPGNVLASIQDWNAVSDAQTVTYTFGIGLEAFCGSVSTGAIVQNTLPNTVLEGGSVVTLTSLNPGGGVIAGDQFLQVVLYGISDAGGQVADVIPLLTPLALAG